MIDRVRIAVLVENIARGRHLLGEHGLSFYIEVGDHRLLFDTGQGKAIRNNAEVLGEGQLHGEIGGMHLTPASHQRIQATHQAFERYGVRLVGPCHCEEERRSNPQVDEVEAASTPASSLSLDRFVVPPRDDSLGVRS